MNYLQPRICHTDFISPSLVLTPIHCFIIIFLTLLSQKATKSAYTQTWSGSDDCSSRYANEQRGFAIERSAKNSLTRSLIILRSVTFIRTILIITVLLVLFVIAWLPILPLSYGITRYTFYVYFRNSCMLCASFKIWNYVVVNINMRDVYIDSTEPSATVIP